MSLEDEAARTGPVVVGVINLSPESTNRASVVTSATGARRRARALVRQGATIIDLGARSSSPSSPIVSDDEEQARLLPVLEALNAAGHTVSVDTWSAPTALLALERGAAILNYTSAEDVLGVAAAVERAGRLMVVSFMPYGDAYRMRDSPYRRASIDDIARYFESQLSAVTQSVRERLILDPNIGMLHPELRADRPRAIAWRLEIISRIDVVRRFGLPLMLALPRRDGLGATRMFAWALLNAEVDYVRAHDPAVVSEMQRAMDA